MENHVMQYVIDASLHVNMAMELESNKMYEEAFTAYKAAIDILLKYGKGTFFVFILAFGVPVSTFRYLNVSICIINPQNKVYGF